MFSVTSWGENNRKKLSVTESSGSSGLFALPLTSFFETLAMPKMNIPSEAVYVWQKMRISRKTPLSHCYTSTFTSLSLLWKWFGKAAYGIKQSLQTSSGSRLEQVLHLHMILSLQQTSNAIMQITAVTPHSLQCCAVLSIVFWCWE